MTITRLQAVEALYAALQSYERLFQFRDPNNACLFDLRVNECYALELIVAQGPVSVVGLADALGVHKSNASRIARALEASGFAEEIPDPADGRAVLWRATAKGRRKYEGVRRYLIDRFDTTLRGFKRADLQTFVEMLDRLREDAEERLAEQCGVTRSQSS